MCPLIPFFNEHISLFEVKKAIFSAKQGKACGFDNIPSEVLRNDTAVSFLHILFNVCFDAGVIPSDWGKCIINPIPKSCTDDKRDPLSYRGIALASSMYKLYCSILNDRLGRWSDNNDKIVDEQNGFRKKRSTIDHLSSLTTLLDTRRKRKLSTYCAFIDFKKAYDCINRDILWNRLSRIGVSGKLFGAVKSLYSSVSACVRVNNLTTEWFNVNCGVRQGCCLSPLLFNLFINDLALQIKTLGKGVQIDNELISIMLYADDVVLLAENSADLQIMINTLHEWCNSNCMTVNSRKSNVVHFRPNSVQRSDFEFTCGSDKIGTVDRYSYLGITLTEFLDFDVTAKIIAQSASRALGLLIAKYKNMGGMPYEVFTKLFDSMVWPIISYGAAIWGSKAFSCINAVQNRAMRFFLGTGKYTPIAAIFGEMAWNPPIVKQWKCISAHWVRLVNMESVRLNKRIFSWGNDKSSRFCKNWIYRAKEQFNELDLSQFCDISNPISKSFSNSISNKMMEKFEVDWSNMLNTDSSRRGNGGNKLRTYKLFKTEFKVEEYCQILLPLKHRSAFAKFRCGVAPIKIETGRYENLAVEERICPFCNNIEDEMHVILDCSVYDDLRVTLFDKAADICPGFNNISNLEKFKTLFSEQGLIRFCAKTCFNILMRRNSLLFR